MQTSRRIGMPWYTREGFAAARDIMTDQHAFAATWDEWRVSAEHNEQVARSCGIEVVRAVIAAEPFLRWCEDRKLSPDGNARMRFAEERAHRQEPTA